MADKPMINDRVHYVAMGHSLGTYSSTCRAAIVTDVKDELTIGAAVFSPKGLFFYEALTYDEGKAGGTWHWPEAKDGPTSSIMALRK